MRPQHSTEDRGQRAGDQSASATLPASDTHYWMPTHKAQVVEALRREELTVSEACERYGLMPEELAVWGRAYDWGGIRGLTLVGMKLRRRTVHEPGRA
jgi:hypothetical protein